MTDFPPELKYLKQICNRFAMSIHRCERDGETQDNLRAAHRDYAQVEEFVRELLAEKDAELRQAIVNVDRIYTNEKTRKLWNEFKENLLLSIQPEAVEQRTEGEVKPLFYMSMNDMYKVIQGEAIRQGKGFLDVFQTTIYGKVKKKPDRLAVTLHAPDKEQLAEMLDRLRPSILDREIQIGSQKFFGRVYLRKRISETTVKIFFKLK